MKHILITLIMGVIPFAFAFLVVTACMGCAQHISIETVTRDGVEYRSEVKQNLFLWYETKAIEHITDFSSVAIGDTTTDPNTAKAVVEGAVDAVIGGGL
jgi:hypothetical protein